MDLRLRKDKNIEQLLQDVIEKGTVTDEFDTLSELYVDVDGVSQVTLNTYLLSACKSGLNFLVKCLLLCNIDIDCKDDEGNTPLMICAFYGFRDIVEMLIKKGSDINCTNTNGDTALILSVTKSGSKDLVKLLLEQSEINIYRRNFEGDTCLTKSLKNFDFEITQIILEKAKSLNSVKANKLRYNEMLLEAQRVATYLKTDRLLRYIEQEISESKSALLSAASESDWKSVQFLLDFKLTKEPKDSCKLLAEILYIIKNKKMRINQRHIAVISTLINNGKTFQIGPGSEKILAIAVHIGSCELLDLLCQYVRFHCEYSQQFVEEVYHHGLSAVCEKCNDECLKILMHYKTDLMSVFGGDQKLMEKAVKNGAKGCVEMFLNQANNINVGNCLCIFAIKNNRTDIFNKILDTLSFTADFSIALNMARLIRKAVKAENKEIIEKLLFVVDVNEVYKNKTLLMRCKCPEIATMILAKNATLDVMVESKHYNAFLFLFSSQNSWNNLRHMNSFRCAKIIELASLYLRHGANIEDKDSEGRTALMLVSSHNQVDEVLTFLLESGADPSNRDRKGRTALHFAASGNCLKNLEILLACKANEMCNETIDLHLPKKDTLQGLLKHRDDVNMVDNEGNTPLLLASRAYGFDMDVITWLIDQGSNLDHQNAGGRSAMMIAAENECTNLVLLLCEKGASINLRSSNLENAVDILVDKITMSKDSVGQLVSCVKTLVEKGGSAAGVKPECIFNLIRMGQHNFLQNLIAAGLSPSECSCERFLHQSSGIVSPFCYALINNYEEMAQYFIDISFFTASDISNKLRLENVLSFLKEQNYTKCFTILENFSRQPLSLYKLCHVTVSSQYKTGIEKEENITQLGLPEKLTEELTFKTRHRLMITLVDLPEDDSMANREYLDDDDSPGYYTGDDAQDTPHTYQAPCAPQ